MPTCPRCVLFALLLGVLAFSGCDTNNPGSSLTEVQGVYAITELSFNPDQPEVLADINVLAGLRAGATIEVVGDGQAVVRFERIGSASQLVIGTARATSRLVSVTARTDADAGKLERILLPAAFSLNRDEVNANRLSANIDVDGVDLEAYDPQYGSLNDVSGRLTITLNRTNP